MRKLMRSVARAAMKQAGLVWINKSGYFAMHWREWVNGAPMKVRRRR